MLLHYCSLHAQLFIWKDQAWKDFPLAKIDQIREFGSLLRSVNPTSTALTVLERPCDQCAEAIHQVRQISRMYAAVEAARATTPGQPVLSLS